jgi:2-phosphoglycerate kinase
MRDDVRWIGGSPCSGKSTVAAMIAAARRVAVYSCDAAFDRHTLTGGPTMRKVAALGIGDRLAQPIETQVDDVLALYREEFPQILQDLADRPDTPVVEGAALLPELLAARQVPPQEAVWIVPSEEFQRSHYRRRQWAWPLLAGLNDPEAAFDRWMRRDIRFAELVAEQAHDHGYRVIVTDGSVPAAGLAASL